MFSNTCPFCGVKGRKWHREPEAFMCPNCRSIFSKFGVIAGKEEIEFDEPEISN